MTPGCQTFFSHIDRNGIKVKEGFVFDFKNGKRLKFAPFSSHNAGGKAIGCADCHGNPTFYGYGDGLYSSLSNTFTSSIICEHCDRPLNSLYSIANGEQNIASDIVRENSRIFTKGEIAKIIDANRCIVCHDRADMRYYSKEVNYDKVLNDTVHKPLLR
jgi:cytochrome c553